MVLGIGTVGMAAGVVIGLVLLLFLGNFMVELADHGRADYAWQDTQRVMLAFAGGVVGLIGSGIVNLGQFVDQIAELLGVAPWALSQLATVGLGWLGLSGTADLEPRLYVGISLAFLGIALLSARVKR